MIGILLWNFLVFVAGAVSMMISIWWWMTSQDVEQIQSEKSSLTESILPDELVNKLKQEEGFHRRETCLSLNLILQFFFQEKRFEAGIMRWITNILTQEFNDLLKHRALSKFIHNMQIRDLNLGTNFPVIRAVTAKHVNLNPETSILEQIDINVEVEYNGGIQLAIDASSRFSKAAMVKIKVVHLSGNGRLQFSRHPFTHWSFSFYDEPQVEFEVHSSLGLHIPRFNSVIVSQLRGILKRKHTLPYFKLRGAPLIRRHNQQINEEGCSVPPGRLTGSIVKCTRLQTSLVGEVMYCTVILSEVPIVCAVEKTSGLWVVQDISLKRPHGSSVGILLRNSEEGTQMIESVQQNSPAHLAGLRKNDVVLAVNGTYLNSGQQAAKLFSTCNINGDNNSITIRVKRLVYSEAKKILAEHKTVGSDASSAVVGEDASGRLHVFSSAQSSVAPCTSSCSYSGDKSSCAWVDTSSSGPSGCAWTNDVTGAARVGRNAAVGSVGDGSINHGDKCRGGRNEAGNLTFHFMVSSGGHSNVMGGISGGGGSSSSGGRGGSSSSISNCSSVSGCGGGSSNESNNMIACTCSGSSGVMLNGTDDDGMPGGSRAISPSHLLAGIMGTFNGSRPAKHRSLPGSPVLQRTCRNRVYSTRDGDISGSGRSTPDSSHNNSPEMKRKLLDLHSLSTEARPSLLSQDKSPITSAGCKIIPRSVSSTAQDKSPCSTSSQSFPAPHQPTSERPPSTQSSKAGTPTSSETLMNIINSEKRGLKKYGGKHKQIKLLQTPFIDGTCEPVFDSDFEFWLEEENKYMCVAVWSRSISNSKEDLNSLSSEKLKEDRERCRSKDGEKERKKSRDHEKTKTACENVTGGLTDDTLVGFINLPFISLIPETTLNTQGHVIKILNLTPPHPKCPEVASDPLISHKGFNPNLCYGDVMISLTYQPQDRCDVFGRVILEKNALSEDESLTDGTLSEDDDVPTIQEAAEDRNHDFKRTHFHSATQCNFCRKKIWLKDAYQCSECGIICHKKCMVRCEQETVCDPSGLRYKDSPKSDNRESRESKETPEIITTIAVGPGAENGSPGNTPPPSPQGSLTEASNPFLFDQDVGDNIQEALDRLLLFPHDERLVTLARESAKNLHCYVPVEERREKINSTLAQLQTAVDSEGEVRVDLARQEKEANETGNNISRASIALQISQCDARTQALALLTLHYCTALQHCNTDSENDDNNMQQGKNSEPEFLEGAGCEHLLPKPTEE
ncbi:hypothetical protein O3P69_002273 [Scylla paramamosain]|uniref:PDZ domain-containing protein 8 n=1 Tax=Scylla paramamosain TaxID=85552 RepID=A0AAW0V873_SCYPA